jgi:hypothetical protein
MTREQQAVEGLRSPTTRGVDCSVAKRSAFVECVATADFGAVPSSSAPRY